ncbi:Acyl-CoA-binding like protein [Termitomyces sp. J132]|nr:Acyl-CoA-binding like protein [Termitomyces sp. J132]
MASSEVIDAQFNRAVEIVQSLPKTGPIQTDYEEKLTMYSLYKQATVGNVKTPRPGMWDMLGRAKWDAWAKHRDLDPLEAKWLYVDALLKAYPHFRSADSDTSGSTISDDEPSHPPPMSQSQTNRPSSSLSSHKYRTPLATSVVMSPPPIHGVPSAQPRPDFTTPSAFAADSSPISQSRGPQQPLPPFGSIRPASEATLERAIENVQVHLAALTERMDSLETSLSLSRSNTSLTLRHLGSPRGRHSPNESRGPYWDLDDLGMWSIVVSPISRVLDKMRELATFFARNEDRSPTRMVIRRLCLDVSFLVCVLAIVRLLWKRSGVRRREVNFALRVLWQAILGAKPDRVMIDRGV